MTAIADDLVVVLTGGSSNNDPYESLGGEPSSQPIIGVLNNLFENISPEEALTGKVDYRCIYVFNNNTSDDLYEVKLYVVNETAGGSEIELGIIKKQEVQRVIVSGSVSGGSFDITYQDETKTVNYHSDPATWAANLETALNEMDLLEEVSVSVAGNFTTRIFNINFGGEDDYRFHDLLEIDTANLTGTSIAGTVSRLIPGEPINSVPSSIDIETTTPTGVEFTYPTAAEPMVIGTLRAEEGFPLWIKRTTPATTTPIANDGVKLRISFMPI